eukprot:6552463-Pyramimonas_sp.AAC.1
MPTARLVTEIRAACSLQGCMGAAATLQSPMRRLLPAAGATLMTLLLSALSQLPHTAARQVVICHTGDPFEKSFSTDLYDLPSGDEVSAAQPFYAPSLASA